MRNITSSHESVSGMVRVGTLRNHARSLLQEVDEYADTPLGILLKQERPYKVISGAGSV